MTAYNCPRTVHTELLRANGSAKLEEDVREWFADVPGSELMHALQTPCASMLASNIGSGDGSFSTDFARSWDTDGPKWLNFERGVHRLSHSDSVLLARFVVSLDAWTPHLHDICLLYTSPSPRDRG
eukprot:2503598-Rhodomonas_salina.2